MTIYITNIYDHIYKYININDNKNSKAAYICCSLYEKF